MRSISIRKLCLSTLCSFILVTFSPSLFAVPPSKESNQKTNQSAEQTQTQDLYLFVQGAHEATLSKNPAANQSDYLLALKNVNPYVTVFTERPARKTRLITLKKYLTMWSSKSPNNFRQNPPNAAFHAIKKNAASDAEALNYILEINTPKYDAATKTLTYNVNPLKGNTEALPEGTSLLHHAILFVDDDVCLSCW
jgi:hypothetical protein